MVAKRWLDYPCSEYFNQFMATSWGFSSHRFFIISKFIFVLMLIFQLPEWTLAHCLIVWVTKWLARCPPLFLPLLELNNYLMTILFSWTNYDPESDTSLPIYMESDSCGHWELSSLFGNMNHLSFRGELMLFNFFNLTGKKTEKTFPFPAAVLRCSCLGRRPYCNAPRHIWIWLDLPQSLHVAKQQLGLSALLKGTLSIILSLNTIRFSQLVDRFKPAIFSLHTSCCNSASQEAVIKIWSIEMTCTKRSNLCHNNPIWFLVSVNAFRSQTIIAVMKLLAERQLSIKCVHHIRTPPQLLSHDFTVNCI